jgi:hypothetical protein
MKRMASAISLLAVVFTNALAATWPFSAFLGSTIA